MTSTNAPAGFFRSLVDFDFTTFVTLKFLKVIYGLLFGLICLIGLVFFVTLLFRGGVSSILAFIIVPLVTLFYLVLARVSLEIVALLFRIGENTSTIAAASGNGPAAGGPGYGGSGYGPAPTDPPTMPYAPTTPTV